MAPRRKGNGKDGGDDKVVSINGKGKDDFDQGGPDGAPRQRRDAEDDDRNEGHNAAPLGDRLLETAEAIEEEERKIEALNDEHRLRLQPFRQSITTIKREAVEGGLQAAPLNALLRKRKLERKAREAGKNLDQEQQETFEKYCAALGDLADLPLGQAALKNSGLEPAPAH